MGRLKSPETFLLQSSIRNLRSEIEAWDKTYVMGTYARQEPLFVRGEGAYLYDSEGNRYLDFVAGVAVCSLGHCHPRLVEAVQRQAAELIHVSNLYLTAPQARLAKRLCELSGMDRVFFGNTGTEAIEAALKIARKYAKQRRGPDVHEIITLEGSFHGRTMGALSATAQPKYQEPFAPLVPGFKVIPRNDVQALRSAFNDQTAAVLFEPVQGESGVFAITYEFFQTARDLCDQADALLILDEVQTGMGRTGKWFGWQHEGIQPDVMTLAKGLGSGLPIGCCLARKEAATTLAPGDHGSTFAANPLTTTAAWTVIEVIEEENLLANVQKVGSYLKARFEEMQADGAPIADIRAIGLMIGLGLEPPIAKTVAKECLQRGLLVNPISDHTIRLVPPLIITLQQADEAVDILRQAVRV